MNANIIGSPGLGSIVVQSEQKTESLWTTAQAAQVLNRPERSVRRLVQKGDIKGFKVKGKFGDEWRIMPFALEQNTDASSAVEACRGSNNLCFEVPKGEGVTTDSAETIACTVTQQAGCIDTQQDCIDIPQSTSAWNNFLTILKSMLFWISKGEKTGNQIVEY